MSFIAIFKFFVVQKFIAIVFTCKPRSELILVLVNSGINDVDIKLQSQNHPLNGLKAYITSSQKDLSPYDITEVNSITIPARSIITIVSQKP